jgi:hypothetical protein
MPARACVNRARLPAHIAASYQWPNPGGAIRVQVPGEHNALISGDEFAPARPPAKRFPMASAGEVPG